MKRVHRIGLSTFSVFFGTILLLVGVVYAASEARLRRVYDVPLRAALAGADGLSERGRHLASAVAQCTFCHGDDLAGKKAADDPLLGRLHAPNLTPGGLGAVYSDEDFARAIRHGVRPDGTSLLLMPSEHLSAISDEDLAAIIAYLRSVPAVRSDPPDTRVGPLTRAVLVAGLAPELLSAERLDHEAVNPPSPQPSPTADYGAYLVSLGGCRVCHRADLAGGLHPLSLPDEPPPPDITAAGLASWSERDFLSTMRSGVTPDGRRLDHEYMPWPFYARMTDTELRAIWAYLRTVEPGPRG